MIHWLLHILKVVFIVFLKIVFYFFPKNKKVIIFTAWFGKKYADNSRYVFEYMLEKHTDYQCFWMTTDKNLFYALSEKNIPCLFSKTIKAKWMQLRASALVSSVQLTEYNPYLLTHVVYVDLGHGHSIKNPGQVATNKKTVRFNRILNLFIDYTTVVCFDHLPYGQPNFGSLLGKNNVAKIGFARNDVFYDSILKIGKNSSIKGIICDKYVISYLPTHRSDGLEKINVDEILDLKSIDELCGKMNAVFLIKKHFYHRNEKSNLEKYKNIFDITNDESIDTQVLLSDTNILITDYSACFIDFLLLDRPIILYQFDFDKFASKERALLIPFDKIKISSYPKNSYELTAEIKRILENSFDDGFSCGRQEIKDEYFSKDLSTHVRADVSNYIINRISFK